MSGWNAEITPARSSRGTACQVGLPWIERTGGNPPLSGGEGRVGSASSATADGLPILECGGVGLMPAREVHVSNSEGMLPRSSLASHSIGKDAVPLPPSRRAEKPKA